MFSPAPSILEMVSHKKLSTVELDHESRNNRNLDDPSRGDRVYVAFVGVASTRQLLICHWQRLYITNLSFSLRVCVEFCAVYGENCERLQLSHGDGGDVIVCLMELLRQMEK
jgi:hypothetical protein